MPSKKLLLKDGINFKKDTVNVSSGKGLWADTEIILGYGFHDGGYGKSYLDEEIDIVKNTVPICGVQTAMQYLFGVQGPIEVKTLYDTNKIGYPNIDVNEAYDYLKPNHSIEHDPNSGSTKNRPLYNTGHLVQLFGVGVTGTAENNITVHKVDYREMSIDMGGDPPVGVMYPLRYTASELDGSEKTKYFGKKYDDSTGATGYYLKRFENEPQIKHIWKTQDTMDSDNEILVDNDALKDNTRNDAIQSFTEMHLQITKKDLKEFFRDKLEQPESCRFNCIALYDGYYTEDKSYKPDNDLFGDYANVRLFSKLNIPTEHLSLQKDLEIIYRVYGS